MARPVVDFTGAVLPVLDGDVNEYANREALANPKYFSADRKVVFVNGMGNSAQDHVESALALSLLQMCTVIGVYNQGNGGIVADFKQCVGDKNQFNGVSVRAELTQPRSGRLRSRIVGPGDFTNGGLSSEVARDALSRNPPQVSLFNLLRIPELGRCEIFAHSQGNLILSNALQAIAAVDGPLAVAGRVVHTFGSPAYSWPQGVILREHAYSVDPFAMLSGIDLSFSVSKVGTADGSWIPYAHAFLDYIGDDPAFVVNRFRTGGFGLTLNMDEEGLAKHLAGMGGNLRRVRYVFQHLKDHRGSDADDVAVAYYRAIRNDPVVMGPLRGDRALIDLLIDILESGATMSDEVQAISFLRALR